MTPLKPYQLKAEAKVKKFTDQLINSRKASKGYLIVKGEL